MTETDKIIIYDTEKRATRVSEDKIFHVFTDDNPLLRKKIEEYKGDFGHDLKEFLRILSLTRKKYNALGLSPNQCGAVDVNAFVIGQGDYDLMCVNPKILTYSDEKKKMKEGCVSFPGLLLNIERPETIRVEFLNEHGAKVSMHLSGLTARCFQHEYDHLQGIVFTDRVGGVSKYLGEKKRKKFLRKMKNSR